MAKTELLQLEQTLRAALQLRYSVGGLLGLAQEITLVSFNAQAASAQIGDAGRVFSVMTREITHVSTELRQTVTHIRSLTQDWTKKIALGLTHLRRLEAFERAISLAPASAHRRLNLAARPSKVAIQALASEYPKMLHALFGILEELDRAVKLINYVKVSILVEDQRLVADERGERRTFKHLADEMQSATQKIRDIAAEAAVSLRDMRQNNGFLAV